MKGETTEQHKTKQCVFCMQVVSVESMHCHVDADDCKWYMCIPCWDKLQE